ncbi:hypothetical protein H0A66_00540 [Alcaligenaceae bacterium]|nr:hypothetical protein [Alcaligenaceae bacterium]
MRYLLALVVLMYGVGNPAHAKWPTTIWTVLEEKESWLGAKQPEGERKLFAQKYEESLQHASLWFQSMSFKAPYQLNDKKRFDFKGDERYLAYLKTDTTDLSSTHSSLGYMRLSTPPSFLNPESSWDELFTAAAVHELFHGIQKANPEYYKYSSIKPLPPGPKDCDDGERGDEWLTEGSAAAVQVQYLERTRGYIYGHAFNGSPRSTWVRTFDQPLDWGSLPPEHRNTPVKTQHVSWYCSYGTWYFWYAVGNMLGSKDPQDWRRTAYLRYIFDQKGSWEATGLAMVDSGLKQAAQELDAINLYRGGLFSLYPQFVAQYLDVDRFYEKVEKATMTTPSQYETTSSLEGGAIDPMATRAWRFRVELPRNVTPMPYIVRFVLESPDQGSLDGLHLIVDSKVIDRPVDPDVPYSHTRRTDRDAPNDQGDLEYFVRIANVAQDAAATQPAEFVLRVEVEGFYGEKTSGPSNETIAGELAPGFEISGPDKYWTCSGGDDARASFTIVTPEGHANQLERALAQGLKNIENDLDRAELEAQGKALEAGLKLNQQERKKFESAMQSMLQTSGISANVEQAVGEIRRKNETFILANLHGTNAEGACNVLFSATLPGRQPAAQQIAGNHFSMTINPESINDVFTAVRDMAATLDLSEFDLDNMTEEQAERMANQFRQISLPELDLPVFNWTMCSGDRNCDGGVLTLEHVKYDHLSGTFKFQVSRGNDKDESNEYANVTGFINITSSQTESDNSLLDFMSRGQRAGEPLYMPGIEKLLQGGAMFGE